MKDSDLSESVEKASLDETKFNYLYSDESDYYFMNPKIISIKLILKKKLLEKKEKCLTENLEVKYKFL